MAENDPLSISRTGQYDDMISTLCVYNNVTIHFSKYLHYQLSVLLFHKLFITLLICPPSLDSFVFILNKRTKPSELNHLIMIHIVYCVR